MSHWLLAVNDCRLPLLIGLAAGKSQCRFVFLLEEIPQVANRNNHYEVAFEAFLRRRKVPYVAVNESRRSLLREGTLKSLDFIVSPDKADGSYLVDVKGRRFPSGRQYWRNWSTTDELRSLSHWEEVFGERCTGLLVFAYNIVGDRSPLPSEQLFVHGTSLYGFVGVRLDHYLSWAKLISPKWNTVAMPTARFRELAVPMHKLLSPERQLTTDELVLWSD